MVENLDSGKRARRTLRATAILMTLSALLLGARSREAAPRPGEMAGSTGAPMPAPRAFLAAPSGVHGAAGASAPDTSERIAALSKVLSGGDRTAAAAPSEGPAPVEGPGAPVASAGASGDTEVPGSKLTGRAEVVARLERGGAVYWILSVRPEGRLLRAGVSSGAGAQPPPEPYLQRIEGRFELVTRRRRYRVVEPPWEGSRGAVVGESP